MASHELTLTIESANPAQSHISLKDFSYQLTVLGSILSKTEKMMSAQGKASTEWRLEGLSHSSPARVTIYPIQRSYENGVVERTVGGLFHYMEQLCVEVPPEVDRQTLAAYKSFSEKVQKGILRMHLQNGHRDVTVRPEMYVVIETALSPQSTSIGGMKGRLKYMDIHKDNRQVFRIYPWTGPEMVECIFPPGMRKDAIDAINRKVRVRGKLIYAAKSKFPKTIMVEEIEKLAEDADLPQLGDLLGIAPGITGDISSEEYVRRLRSGE